MLERSRAVPGAPSTPPMRRRCSDALEASTGDRGADWISRGPAGRSRVEDGDGTGTAVCVPRPGTPVDAAVDLDGIGRPGVLTAGRRRMRAPWRIRSEAL